MEHLKIGILINNLHQENLNGEIINNILKNKSINFDTIIVNKKSSIKFSDIFLEKPICI